MGFNINAVDPFGNLKNVYNFICRSKKRVVIYETKQAYYYNKQTPRLKRVATMHWLSYEYALETILKTFKAVIETLEDVKNIEGRKRPNY